MRKITIFLVGGLFLFFLAGLVLSQGGEGGFEDIDYPVVELGNCKNQDDCAKYCEKTENMAVCLDFAEANNLMPQDEIDMAKKLLALGEIAGPGGCNSKDSCDAYCDIPDNMEECIIFGRDNGLIPPEELAEAEKALAAIQKGVKPPPCRGKAACDNYCSEPEHLDECMIFAEAAGFVTSEEAVMIRKTGGKGPGGCRGRDACDSFCNDSANMEECVNFGIEHSLIPPDEIEDAQKMLAAIKKGVSPPPCRGREACDTYCSQPEHAEECVNFAEAAGFMTAEEAEMVRKMAKAGIVGGPGGCKGKEECEAFCDNPDNMAECVDFAVKAGMMTQEEAEQAKKMAELGLSGGPGGCKSKEECEAFCQNPDNEEECMNFALQAGLMRPEEAEAMRTMGPEGPGGPGGCRSQEECMSYCGDTTHSEECLNFANQQGLMPQEGRMPAEGMPSVEGMMPPEVRMPEGAMPLPEGGIMPDGMIPGAGILPEGAAPSPEQIQQIQQQYQQQYQQQIEQTMPPREIAPPPTEPPQSFFRQIENFLANVAAVFNISPK